MGLCCFSLFINCISFRPAERTCIISSTRAGVFTRISLLGSKPTRDAFHRVFWHLETSEQSLTHVNDGADVKRVCATAMGKAFLSHASSFHERHSLFIRDLDV